jgi:hypothetical protein
VGDRGWCTDPALVAENDALLRAHGFDFEKLVARKQAANVDRFSVEKVMSLSPDNSEISKLLELAEVIKTKLPPDFECNGDLPSGGFSGLYKQVAPAIHKLLMAIHVKGLAVRWVPKPASYCSYGVACVWNAFWGS